MKAFFLNGLQASISGGCPMLGHCEGVCTSDTMVCAPVRGSQGISGEGIGVKTH
jgi:hypothetical protein